MNKTVFIPVAAVVIGAAILLAARDVSAQTTVSEPNLVQKIAQKFGLSQSDVQAVFDDHHKDMQEHMENRFDQMLTQDVSEGKITDAQKQQIIAKRKEIVSNRQTAFKNWKNLTAEQRRVALQTQRQDTENWAKEHNLDVKYLLPGMRMKHEMWK